MWRHRSRRRERPIRLWIDVANSPHVPFFTPVVRRAREDGWEVVLTARDHAQTVELAAREWADVSVVGGESPRGRAAKGAAVLERARLLRAFASAARPDVALSHGSYAQVVAARAASVPAVTLMDYEYQPANHLSFRLARRVVVPRVFPGWALRRFGARAERVVRYDGFKEEVYLAGFAPDSTVLDELGVDGTKVLAVLRPAPHGALYHRGTNERFEALLERAAALPGVDVVVLPRTAAQREAYARRDVVVPAHAVDGRSLLACADVTIGAGGTMNRESALLGTPTYTVFAERLACVDAELIRLGLLHDLRQPGSEPAFAKKPPGTRLVSEERSRAILDTIVRSVEDARRDGAR